MFLTESRNYAIIKNWGRASKFTLSPGFDVNRTLSSLVFFIAAFLISTSVPCHSVPASISGLSATSTSDRRIDVDWSDVSEYDYYKVYTSTNLNQLVLISTPPVSFYTLTISTNIVKPTMYYFQVAVSSNGVDGPLSSVVSTTVTINIEYYDVDGDGVLEKAENLDNDDANGFETYNDPNMNSSVLFIADMTSDGKMDFLLDTNADGLPDKFWAPADGVVTIIILMNVDLDDFLEHTIDTDGDGRYDKFYDEQENRIVAFCRIEGAVSPSAATVSLAYAGAIIESTQSTGGRYTLIISTLSINDYYDLFAYATGYAVKSIKVFLKHGEVYQENFNIPLAAVSSSFGVHTFPNPVKQKTPATVVVENNKEV